MLSEDPQSNMGYSSFESFDTLLGWFLWLLDDIGIEVFDNVVDVPAFHIQLFHQFVCSNVEQVPISFSVIPSWLLWRAGC